MGNGITNDKSLEVRINTCSATNAKFRADHRGFEDRSQIPLANANSQFPVYTVWDTTLTWPTLLHSFD
jgi:hypothetical protein